MGTIVGIVLVFVMVFGGYTLAGGKFGIIIKALPFEFMMIGGSAAGAFAIQNPGPVIKHTLHDIPKAMKGAKWKTQDYNDLLCLMYQLIRKAQQDPLAIERDLEEPNESEIFKLYPKILGDKRAVTMICDTMRASTMNLDDPHQVEDILEKQLEADLHDAEHSSHALQGMADGLPALGIVAAVLGIIKTMGSIDSPPTVLGKMIGGALVGTFLGVFLAYGLVGPLAGKLGQIAAEEHKFYELIRNVLIASLQKHSPNVCVEVARQNTPRSMRPTFAEMEQGLKDLRGKAA